MSPPSRHGGARSDASPSPAAPPGRVLAVDLGARRIGLAVSDELRLGVRPLGTVAAAGPRRDAQAVRALVAGLDIGLLVVGLPLLPSGEEGAAARRARAAGQDLARRLELPLAFVDERESTRDAGRAMIAEGLGRRTRRERVDAMAAAVILDTFLAEGPHGG